jgi:hypothetical protein
METIKHLTSERQEMIATLMAVAGINDVDFAHEFLQGNDWQLEASVNTYMMIMFGEDEGGGGGMMGEGKSSSPPGSPRVRPPANLPSLPAPAPPVVQRLVNDMPSVEGPMYEAFRNFAAEGVQVPQERVENEIHRAQQESLLVLPLIHAWHSTPVSSPWEDEGALMGGGNGVHHEGGRCGYGGGGGSLGAGGSSYGGGGGGSRSKYVDKIVECDAMTYNASDWIDANMPEWLKQAMYGSKPPVWGWTGEQEEKFQSETRDFKFFWLGWPKTQEANHQSELRLGEAEESKADENHRNATLELSHGGYVSAALKEHDRKGFSSAHVVITNQGRALMVVFRFKKTNWEAKLRLGLTGGQRQYIKKEDAWTCACREAGEETGGFAAKFLRGAAPPARVAWLGLGDHMKSSKWVEGKVVYTYETADHWLAEDIQSLRRPPEGRQGLLSPEGAPLTAVWVPLACLHNKKFRHKYLPGWAQDDRIWIDLVRCDDAGHSDSSDSRSWESESYFDEWECKVCRKIFRSERALHQHEDDTRHSETWKCKECGKTFGSERALGQHENDTRHYDRSDSSSTRERERRGGRGGGESQGSSCGCQACSYRVKCPEKECMYGSKCSQSNCPFAHPSPSYRGSKKRKAGEEENRCRYGIGCNDSGCEFSHPSPVLKCRYEREHQDDVHSGDKRAQMERKRGREWEKEKEGGRERERRGPCECQACSYRVKCPEKQCMHGSKCSQSNCPFAHPSPSYRGSKKRKAGDDKGRCRYGIRCNDSGCEFSHPSPVLKCRF